VKIFPQAESNGLLGWPSAKRMRTLLGSMPAITAADLAQRRLS
jgi:hypothetical protein